MGPTPRANGEALRSGGMPAASSVFPDSSHEETKCAHGVERSAATCSTRMPCACRTANVVFMTGMKFGSSGQELTWAMNAYVPQSRKSIAAAGSWHFPRECLRRRPSIGVVKEMAQPVGEYARLPGARTRSSISAALGIPMVLVGSTTRGAPLRRAGGSAQRALREEPIDLAMGHFNVIWQGDANACVRFDRATRPGFTRHGPEILGAPWPASRPVAGQDAA